MKPWYEETANKYADQLKRDGRWISSREAAPIIGKGKTVAGEFMNWLRDRDGDAPETTEALTTSDKSKTWVDQKSGVIFTDLGDYGIKHVTEGEFRAIKRDYSRHYGGVALSRQEIALRYNFVTIKAFEIFAHIHELRQNGLPFTDTELAEDGVEALVEKTIESQRQAFFLKLNEREREQEKRDAEKWRAFEVNARAITEALRGAAAKPLRPVARNSAPGDHALLINLQDVHYGKLAHDAQGRRIYDRAEASRRTLAAVQDLLDQSEACGHPEEVLLVVGGDFLHFDNFAQLTSSLKTSQGGQSDGNYREILTEGAALAMDMVRLARARARVRVLVVYGNHDQQSSLFLGLLLQQAFAGDAQVDVVLQADGSVFTTYGENSILVCHGQNLKEKDVYRVLVNAAEEQGQPVKRAKLVFTGHVHHERAVDLNGIKLHVCPSLSEADDWHRANHYTGATVEAQAFLIRRSGGKSAVFYSQPDRPIAV